MLIHQQQFRQTGRLLPVTKIGLCFLLLWSSRSAIADPDPDALEEIFGQSVIASNVHAVRARAASLPAGERFDFLLESVLPASGNGLIRMAGEFTQTDPAPVSGDQSGQGPSAGGELVSPVYDLFDVARESGRLFGLRERVESLPASADEFQQRAQAALRLLANLELGDQDRADVAANDLLRLVLASNPTTIAAMWPETLVVYRGVHRHRSERAIADLLAPLYMERSLHTPIPGIEIWHTHLSALVHTQNVLVNERGLHPLAADDVWHPVGRYVAHTRGTGYPQAVWMRSNRQLHHVSGHQVDYLLYQSPLRGNYEVEADLHSPAATQVIVAGRILGMSAGGRGVITGTFRDGTVVEPVERHWGARDPWVRYRAVVRDGTLRVSLDGREVHTEPLSEHHDPWIGVHSGARSYARVRDIRITGDPEVPETVTLSALPDLRGWVSYHHESINHAEGVCRWEADPESSGQIIARRDASLTGTFAESLLRYQRPLIEDGSIDYEFFYETGATEAHPALDRLAFLMQPDGVSVHWITDSRYDTSAIGPDNVFEEPQNRRGPDRLPLRSGEWNRVKLSVVGETVSLELNRVLIYERELEPTNRRTFGLFRYADRELRVRNIVLRGDWPETVPATTDQELADPAIAVIDARLPELEERFDHEFSQDGFPERFFQSPHGKPAPLVTPSGLTHIEWSIDDGWSYCLIRPTVEMQGDFDVTLRFDDLQTSAVNCGCGLGLFLGDRHMELIRRSSEPLVERVLATFVTPMTNGGKRRDGHYLTTEAHAGTFRIVRRGDTITALFADSDSTVFRVVAEHTWEDCGELPATLDIRTMAHNRGQTQVRWKRFEVAAERLMRIPTEPMKPVVFTMNADGSDLRQLTQPMPEFVWHASPEWSPDGRRIVFDAWTGRAESSHIYIINDDGSELTDLGVGIIPSFSPDGKRIAFTWGGHGTTIMNVDGTGRQVLTPEGWGCQWSPDGRWIVYGSSTSSGANLTLIDVNTQDTRPLLEGEHAERYNQIQWNMGWSPDSRRIIFKGHQGGGSETAIVSVDGSSTGFHIVTSENLSGCFNWHPDGSRILLSKGGKLNVYDVETKQFQLLPGQPMDQGNGSPAWDPVTERVLFTSTPKPESVPW